MLLDLILIPYEDDVTNLNYMLHIGRSDHTVLIFDSRIVDINKNVSDLASGKQIYKVLYTQHQQ